MQMSSTKKETSADTDGYIKDETGLMFRDAKSSSSNGMLLGACKTGNIELVKDLVSKGIDVNVTGMWESTPLIVALQYDHFNVAEFLLEKCSSTINVNHVNEKKISAILVACMKGKTSIFYTLVKLGAYLFVGPSNSININHIESLYRCTPLSITCICGTKSMMETFLDAQDQYTQYLQNYYINPSSQGDKSISIKAQILNTQFKFTTTKSIKSAQSDHSLWNGILYQQPCLTTPLMLACAYGNIDIINILLDQKPLPDISLLDSEHCTIFHHIARCVHSTISVLSTNDNTITSTDKNGKKTDIEEEFNVFTNSRKNDSSRIVISTRIRPNDDEKEKDVTDMNLSINYTIFKKFSDLNLLKLPFIAQQDFNGNTPLHLLCERLQTSSCRLILAAYSNQNSNNSKGVSNKNPDSGAVEGCATYINLQNCLDGSTCLHIALRRKNEELIKLLLENGADPLITDTKGVSAYDMSKNLSDSYSNVKILIENKVKKLLPKSLDDHTQIITIINDNDESKNDATSDSTFNELNYIYFMSNKSLGIDEVKKIIRRKSLTASTEESSGIATLTVDASSSSSSAAAVLNRSARVSLRSSGKHTPPLASSGKSDPNTPDNAAFNDLNYIYYMSGKSLGVIPPSSQKKKITSTLVSASSPIGKLNDSMKLMTNDSKIDNDSPIMVSNKTGDISDSTFNDLNYIYFMSNKSLGIDEVKSIIRRKSLTAASTKGTDTNNISTSKSNSKRGSEDDSTSDSTFNELNYIYFMSNKSLGIDEVKSIIRRKSLTAASTKEVNETDSSNSVITEFVNESVTTALRNVAPNAISTNNNSVKITNSTPLHKVKESENENDEYEVNVSKPVKLGIAQKQVSFRNIETVVLTANSITPTTSTTTTTTATATTATTNTTTPTTPTTVTNTTTPPSSSNKSSSVSRLFNEIGVTNESNEKEVATSRVTISINTLVEGNYEGKGRWFKGKISQINNDNTYDITYEDGDIETKVQVSNISFYVVPKYTPDIHITVGSLVVANFQKQGKWFKAKITTINKDNTLDIAYDDGDSEKNIDPSFVRLLDIPIKNPVDENIIKSVSSETTKSVNTIESKTIDNKQVASNVIKSPLVLDTDFIEEAVNKEILKNSANKDDITKSPSTTTTNTTAEAAAVIPSDNINKASTDIIVDSLVEANYAGEGKWYKGKITKVHPNGTFDILYNDGDRESKVKPSFVRLPLESPKESQQQRDSVSSTAPTVSATSTNKNTTSTDATTTDVKVSVNEDDITKSPSTTTTNTTAEAAAVIPSDNINKASTDIIVDSLVEANYAGEGKWYKGKITKVHPNGTYDILYNDGDRESKVKPSFVRLPLKSPKESQQQRDSVSSTAPTAPATSTNKNTTSTDATTTDVKDSVNEDDITKSPSTTTTNTTAEAAAVIPSDNINKASTDIIVDSLVEANYAGEGKWYKGKITKVHPNGTFDILYNDGDRESKVKPSFVRLKIENVRASILSMNKNSDTSQAGSNLKSPGKLTKNVSFDNTKDIALTKTTASTTTTTNTTTATTTPPPSTTATTTATPTALTGQIPNEKTTTNNTKTSTIEDTNTDIVAKIIADSLVEANFAGEGKWYKGKITKVHPNGTYDILYNDGDRESKVKPSFVRLPLESPKESQQQRDSVSSTAPTVSATSTNKNTTSTDTTTTDVKDSVNKDDITKSPSTTTTNTTAEAAAVIPSDNINKASTDIIVDSLVEANYAGEGKWYKGKITKVHPNGTYDILYNDGDRESKVKPSFVRLPLESPKESQQQRDSVSSTAPIVSATSTNKNTTTVTPTILIENDVIEKIVTAHDKVDENINEEEIENMTSDDHAIITEGSFIESNFSGKGKWYKGKVIKVRTDGTYDIAYDDGDAENKVSASNVRLYNVPNTIKIVERQMNRRKSDAIDSKKTVSPSNVSATATTISTTTKPTSVKSSDLKINTQIDDDSIDKNSSSTTNKLDIETNRKNNNNKPKQSSSPSANIITNIDSPKATTTNTTTTTSTTNTSSNNNNTHETPGKPIITTTTNQTTAIDLNKTVIITKENNGQYISSPKFSQQEPNKPNNMTDKNNDKIKSKNSPLKTGPGGNKKTVSDDHDDSTNDKNSSNTKTKIDEQKQENLPSPNLVDDLRIKVTKERSDTNTINNSTGRNEIETDSPSHIPMGTYRANKSPKPTFGPNSSSSSTSNSQANKQSKTITSNTSDISRFTSTQTIISPRNNANNAIINSPDKQAIITASPGPKPSNSSSAPLRRRKLVDPNNTNNENAENESRPAEST